MRGPIAVALALAPGLAAACPVCARDSTPYAALLVLGMVAAPYLVAAAVIRSIRAGGGGP